MGRWGLLPVRGICNYIVRRAGGTRLLTRHTPFSRAVQRDDEFSGQGIFARIQSGIETDVLRGINTGAGVRRLRVCSRQ